jgi:hypothetical protein
VANTPQQPFTRLAVPNATDDVKAAISDVYDKLASNITTPPNLAELNSQIATLQAQVQALINNAATAQGGSSGTPASGGGVIPGPPKPVFDITGAIGRAANPQYAFLPALTPLPGVNPTADAPYAQDGLTIELTTSPTLRGTLWRYDLGSTAWVGPMLGGIIADTHANRANYDPVDYLDVIYYETDRKVAYYSDGTDWIYMTGVMEDTLANRPADLGAHDANFLFLATDTPKALYRWDGSGWAVALVTTLLDTHANRIANYPAASWPIGTQFYETDRTVTYVNKSVTGTPTWVYESGQMYDSFSNRPATLGTADTGFLFMETDRSLNGSVDNFPVYRWNGTVWILVAGEFFRNQADIAALVATFTTHDVGAVIDVVDYNHRLLWDGSALSWAPGDTGSGYIAAFLVDPSPTTGWHVCDGTSANVLNYDGSVSSVVTPNLDGNSAFLQFKSTSSATLVAAVAPTLTMNSYTPAGTNSTVSFTPAGTISATFSGDPLGTHNHELPFRITATQIITNTSFGSGSSRSAVATFSGTGSAGSAACELSSSSSAGTPSGSVSGTFTGSSGTVPAETFTGTPATLTGTISTTGKPQAVQLRGWLRC